MKTMKQIADELGIDKQKVYRYIKKEKINEAHQKNGVKHYDEAAEKRIKQAFREKEVVRGSGSSDAVIDVLLMQSEILKKQLDAKDKQIEELQKIINQEQQLRALVESKLQLLEQKEEEPKRWRFFGKK